MKNFRRILRISVILTVLLMISLPVYASTYKYDNVNRLLSETYDNGDVIQYTYDSSGNLTSTIRVDHETIDKITVVASSQQLYIGQSMQLNVKLVYKNNNTSDITKYAVYQSSDHNILTVSSTGTINAVSSGSGVINVSYGDKIEKVSVSVLNKASSENSGSNNTSDVKVSSSTSVSSNVSTNSTDASSTALKNENTKTSQQNSKAALENREKSNDNNNSGKEAKAVATLGNDILSNKKNSVLDKYKLLMTVLGISIVSFVSVMIAVKIKK